MLANCIIALPASRAALAENNTAHPAGVLPPVTPDFDISQTSTTQSSSACGRKVGLDTPKST